MIPVYLVRWYGPFSSVDEEKEWEKETNKNGVFFNLYLLNGWKKYSRYKRHAYCGKTERTIYQRFADKGHHIHEYREIDEIYVGSIQSVDAPEHNDILLVEKTLTAFLDGTHGRALMLNETNFNYPNHNIYVISEWWKPNCIEQWKRSNLYNLQHLIPDVLAYNFETNKLHGLMKMKQLK